MDPIPVALANIREGWSPRRNIETRAALMRGHATAGNHQRAEEYAVEIETLQCAERDHQDTLSPMKSDRRHEDWPVGLAHADWADAILRGAWRSHRRVHPATLPMPAAIAAE
ncbi:hypothetical protein [Neotabrizicola sp. VNH66]|uniref:hypothetical protein n=1 Tax=Neotabrizicola sp. VNH66 TaxID=3400918 RepID=UPI003C0E94A4